jgi:hypothetical protein
LALKDTTMADSLTDQILNWFERTPRAQRAVERLRADLDMVATWVESSTRGDLRDRIAAIIDPPATPVESTTESPVESATETPVEPATETPVEPATETPVEPAPETPPEAAAATPPEPAAETPTASPTLEDAQNLERGDSAHQDKGQDGER